jgi:hypothetical protein
MSHVVLTGPVSGFKTLGDGTVVDVGPETVEVASLEQAAELAHLIGLHHAANGHPYDVDQLLDPETGRTVPVQRPFVYVEPDGTTHIGEGGHVQGSHPLDEANGITSDQADQRVLAVRSATPEV